MPLLMGSEEDGVFPYPDEAREFWRHCRTVVAKELDCPGGSLEPLGDLETIPPTGGLNWDLTDEELEVLGDSRVRILLKVEAVGFPARLANGQKRAERIQFAAQQAAPEGVRVGVWLNLGAQFFWA